jgi:hypothetical protein
MSSLLIIAMRRLEEFLICMGERRTRTQSGAPAGIYDIFLDSEAADLCVRFTP